MEITRKIYLKSNKTIPDGFNPTILVVDVNTSILSTQLQIVTDELNQQNMLNELDTINNEPSKKKVQHKIFKVVQNEMDSILKDILISIHPETPIIVNLNFSKLIIPLHNWQLIIDHIIVNPSTKKINFPYHIYVTEQTLIERQDYIDNNVNLTKWIENMTDSNEFQSDYTHLESNETYLDDELFVKTLLMQLFSENNLNENEIEQLLLEYDNLGDLISQLRS